MVHMSGLILGALQEEDKIYGVANSGIHVMNRSYLKKCSVYVSLAILKI